MLRPYAEVIVCTEWASTDAWCIEAMRRFPMLGILEPPRNHIVAAVRAEMGGSGRQWKVNGITFDLVLQSSKGSRPRMTDDPDGILPDKVFEKLGEEKASRPEGFRFSNLESEGGGLTEEATGSFSTRFPNDGGNRLIWIYEGADRRCRQSSR